MQYNYQNSYRNVATHEIYEDFKYRTDNYPIHFVDIFTVTNVAIKFFQLNFYPVEYINKPIINRYPTDVDFQAGTNATLLVEGTDYSINYEKGLLTFPTTYTMSVGQVYEIIGYYSKINLRQFVAILNSSIRQLHKYFPTKDLIQYTATMAGLGPNDEQAIEKLDITGLPFLDINTCYKDILDKLPLKFQRRGKYLIFNSNSVQVSTDYGTVVSTINKQELPIYIEGNLKPDSIARNNDQNIVLNDVFKFSDAGYDCLLLMCEINMYILRLNYNETINVATLKLNTQSIYALIREQKATLAALVGDSALAKGFYPASEAKGANLTLSTSLQ